MIALYLSPIYILLNIYLVRWGLKWMAACHHHFKKTRVKVIVLLIDAFFAFSILIAFLLPAGRLQRIMKLVGNYWLGVLLYLALVIIIGDTIRFILKHTKDFKGKDWFFSRTGFVTIGTVCFIIIASLSIWGTINARIIHTTNYEVTVDKKVEGMDSLNVVLIADTHLGYNIGTAHMRQMVNKINKLNPDIVVFAGDMFDNEYEALDDPEELASILAGIKSTYGTYACYGNHDIQEPILAGFTFSSKDKKKESDPRMDQFMADSNISLLMDEGILIDDSFYVYGRPDYERPGRGITQRKSADEITADMDKTKPILVIDHEPRELQELADAGVDLDLCGHTHDGQMFPGNLTIKLMWENACGYLKKDQMHNIVTSGVGLFGPNMRVGTKAEICNIQVNFK